MRSLTALWPQPAHSVVLLPLYFRTSRPMRLTFLGAGEVGEVVAISVALLFHDLVGHGTRVEWQAAVVAHAAEFRDQLGIEFQPHETEKLGVAILIYDIDPIVPANEILQSVGEGIPAQPQVTGFDVVFIQ